MRTRLFIRGFLGLLIFGLILQACSFLGYRLGQDIDGNKPLKEVVVPIGKIKAIQDGESIELVFNSGETIRGTYSGIRINRNDQVEELGLKKYGARYIDWYDLEDINHAIQWKEDHTATVMLTILGGIVDAGIIIAAITTATFFDAVIVVSNQTTSCPYVYSFNGTEYVLDAEPLGGAIWQGCERMDWEVLRHIAEKNDAYLIKINNELEEIQYLNEVKLEVVDHPQGTAVIPDFYGDFHLIKDAQSPLKAYGLDGANLLSLLEKKDDYSWIANPLNKNCLTPEERVSIFLEYEKPADASQVKLHFNVQNSLWASNFIKEFLKLYGEELDGFYTGLNASTEQSDALIQLMIREGMLDVKVWDGQQWLDGGFIWGVGPLMSKDKVLALDLSRIKTENLKIKLEAPPGFWAVNSVLADYSTIADFSRQEITAANAINELGEDISGLLQHSDEEYYVMPDTTCSAELSFLVPPKRETYERTVILKAQGYYQIKMEEEGPADPITIQRVQMEPGYLAQYANELFERYAQEAFRQ